MNKNGWDTDVERRILWGDCQPSVLNSIFNNGVFRKEIQKDTRNKMVLVSIVSVLFLKNSGQKTIVTQMEKEKYYREIANHQYLTQYVIMVCI